MIDAVASPEGGRDRDPGEPERGGALLRRILPVACIVLLGLFAYANSLRGAFVFDDVRQIRDNPLIRDLGNYLPGASGYRALPTRYLGYLTFALNYRLGKLNPAGYHAFNLAIHLLNAILVYALVVVSLRTPRLRRSSLAPSARAVAFVAAALFVTHPIQTQAVTYIVQRLTSLATTFYLAAVVLYVASRLEPPEAGARWWQRAAYLLSLAAAVAATRTKEIAFTLPLAVLLCEVSFFESSGRKRFLRVLPFAAASLLIPASWLDLGSATATIAVVDRVTRVESSLSRLDYLTTEIAVVAKYLGLLVFPAGQNLDHDFPAYRSLLAPRVVGSLAILLAIAALAIAIHRRSRATAEGAADPGARLVSFGIGWFFVTLAVESSVIPITDVIYEHRVYLPSVGFFVAVAAGVLLLLRRIPRIDATRTAVAGAIPVVLVLAVATLVRNQVWRNDVSLWADSVVKSPGKSRPHVNLGTALVERGRFDIAAGELRRALELDPGSSWARAQLGVALLSLGRIAEGEAELREAIRLKSDDPEAIFNLATVLWRTGRADEAKHWFRRFLEIAPPSYEGARRIAAARIRSGPPAPTTPRPPTVVTPVGAR